MIMVIVRLTGFSIANS